MSATLSPRNLKANRRNARQSTGPVSLEGKARSSRNAISHGIFSSSLLLPGEDPVALRKLRIDTLRRLNPRDSVELQWVEQFISASWRIQRIRAAEAELYELRNQKMLTRHEKQTFAMLAQMEADLDDPQAEDDLVQDPSFSSAQILAQMLACESDPALERLQRYEQRLENSMNRCLNQLRKLQDQPQEGCLSDFTGELLEREGHEEEPIVQNEPVLDKAGVTVGQTRGLATDRAQMNTDQYKEEGLEAEESCSPNANGVALGSDRTG